MAATPLEVAACTEVGLVRSLNEDYIRVLPEYGILALADGMGGHNAGEIASEVAVEVAVEELRHAQRFRRLDAMQALLAVRQAAERANASVFTLARQKPELRGMGTTLVLALFQNGYLFHAHVGDSRLYLFRDGRLTQLTRDHSLIQEVIDHGIYPNRGEAREAGVGDNVLTRSLGMDFSLEIDINRVAIHAEDRFLLCSDGLSSFLPSEQIERIIATHLDDLQAGMKTLVGQALDAGGRDNISVVLARPLPAPLSVQPK